MFNKKSKLSIIFLTVFTLSLCYFSSLNATIGDAIKTYKTPAKHPTGMTFDGKNIWLADKMTYKIYAIDPQNGEVIKSFPAPGFEPRGLAWDGELLWCVDAEEGWIYGINTKTGVAENILESNSPNPAGLTFDGEFLWLIDSKEKQLLKINRIDGMMHENIPAPSGNSNGLTYDGKYLWVTDNGDDMLYRVNPASGSVVTFIPSVGPYPYGICWDRKTLWCSDYQNCQLQQLNLKDENYIIKKDPKTYYWELMHDFRNYGPDTVTELDIFMAVPKDLDNQKIIEQIQYDPKPTKFVTDKWDQKFAHFHFNDLKLGERVLPKMKVKVQKYHTIYSIFPERVGALEDIPKEIKRKYLADGLKYDIKNPIIQEGVKQAVKNEKHPYWMMRKIFDYICENINYKLKPLGGWNPAPTVLKRGTGSCSEYTFIFISLCRAAGLPARYAGSIVIRGADKGIDDVWHRWAEVYLPNYGWIPVDVSAGDSPIPANRARKIGVLRNKYLITTKGGGDSEYLEFYYNFNAKWKTKGKCKIHSKQFGEFVPIEK